MDQKTKQLYDFIVRYKQSNDGNSPGREQMAEAIGLKSKSGVNEYLDRLELAGKIERKHGKARAIIVVGGRWISPLEDQMKRES